MNLKKIRFEVEVEGTAVARPDVPIFTTLNVDGPFSLPPAPVHNVYFVKYDVTVSFMTQV